MTGFMRSYRGPLPTLTPDEQALAKRLSDHVWMLAGDIGQRSLTSSPEGLERAAGYIEYVLKGCGYEIEREEFTVQVASHRNVKTTKDALKFPIEEHKTWNVIAELPGASPQVILVGAHYDSVYDCPAANDNGSGVAALLEIARALKTESLKHTLRFVAFTNEEPPFFTTNEMGSMLHADNCKKRGDKIAAMICLETIGYFTNEPNSQKFPHSAFGLIYPTTGNFISFVSNVQSAKLLNRCLTAFRKSVKFPSEGISVPSEIKGVDFSDQRSFWKHGYPGIMITDTAFYRYPHYHEQTDTPDKIDYENLARVVTGLIGMVRSLAK